MNVTSEQKKILLDWMKLHPEVARGRIRQKGESKNKMKELLEDMANTINIVNKGPSKSSSEWFKTWKDWKMYVLKKETKRRNYVSGTGGGSPIKIDLSLLEEELLDFVTPEAAGLENIPQGGLNLYQNASSEETMFSHNLHDIHDTHPQPYKNNLPLCKRPYTSNEMSYNFKGSETKSMSAEMIDIQKEKLLLKKEELLIQKQCLEVQRSALTELRQIRSTIETSKSFQEK
ncbi:PREDICTED: uncharacterized protein LOC108758510 [Trachymyrmex cornetzi]|uniref:uncharacterized protein LOC108758510 n=1 Tax=Trachymyrmex cornetzi TaxID=471704 RepID=UPI00084F0BA3|nr:PREDICTED: uncharacterized protein LOC108758510 [Trachymyrmex cornetzi]